MAQVPPVFPFAASTINSTRPNTVLLKVAGYRKEAFSSDSSNIYPGMWISPQTDGTVKRNGVTGGSGEKMICYEDALQGHWFQDPMVSGDLVNYVIPLPGDIVLALVDASAAAITQGQDLISAGDGTVQGTFAKGANLLYTAVVASSPISNTTAATAFSNSFTIPANFLQVGDIIRIRVQCIATAVNSTNTVNVQVLIGSTVLAATGAVNPTVNDTEVFDITLTIRTIGASGTFVATGSMNFGTPGTSTAKSINVASTTIDTTATQLISATATWSVANVGNSIRNDTFTVESDRGISVLGNALESVDNSGNSATMAYIRMEVR